MYSAEVFFVVSRKGDVYTNVTKPFSAHHQTLSPHQFSLACGCLECVRRVLSIS